MLRPYLADGAHRLVLVKHRAAHVAADLALGGPLDGPQILEEQTTKLRAVLPGVGQLIGAGLEADPEALHRPQFQLLEPLHDVGYALAAPAVAAEGAGQLSAVGSGEHAGGEVPDGLEGLPHDGGGAQKKAVGVEELLPHLSGVGGDHIVGPHIDAAHGADALCDGLRQLPGVAVGADVGDDDRGPGIGVDDGGPLLIGVQHPGDIAVQHRAVAGADHLQLQGPHPPQGVQHEGLVGADDAVVVVLGGPQIALVVGDLAGQDAVAGVVGAEGVAGHQELVLPDIGVHGVGPVEVGHHHELQGPAVQRQGLAVPDGEGVEIPVDDLLEEADGTGGGHNFDPWIQLQQPLHAAAVVRLRVADHQIVHLLDGRDLLHLRKPAVQALDLGGLKEDCVMLGLEDIGVIGGAKLRIHDDVEYSQVVVQGAGKIKTGLEL